MNIFVNILQVIIAFGLLSVWLFKPIMPLKDEFTFDGYPKWYFYFFVFFRIASAFALLLGLWYHFLVFPAALIVALLMATAISVHIRFGDHWKKSILAFIMLILSLTICFTLT